MVESASLFSNIDKRDKKGLGGVPDDRVNRDVENETSKVIGSFDSSESSSADVNGEDADPHEDEIDDGGALCL